MVQTKHKVFLVTFVLTVLMGVSPVAYNAKMYDERQQQHQIRSTLIIQDRDINRSTDSAILLAKEARMLAEQLCIKSIGATACLE
ncbi:MULTISPECIES: hypothetical protein [Pseudomonas]|uniref:Uncharacterized protein n=1 Tax=Pseudomonas fluorescens TaxID=294 RepID=A0A0D0RTN0_PSEFL|nr:MULTISPECIES: hypothetical protein [Pseudomonas]AZE61380.1 hypothetical protein C4K02_3020 [Pseudomonas synxantha]KIR22947.1 hypothetical protein PFLU3_16300 [Pseudomonas fluorescens]MBJ2227249.1 hypothetical protein [Pseudomonas sp. MF7451]MBW4794425.1 hypothetical protein [Pseudomonas tolaasii]MBW9236980.1 hypothetical protein [Pseudomonas carnis]